ncbi:MAG: hypothetical protein AB7O67_23780 [Vicinamibacterales bacterium]
MRKGCGIALFLAAGLAWPGSARAQLGRPLETAGITWTPTVALRDVGTDSNVYVLPQGSPDRMMTFTPSVTSKATSRLLTVSGDAIVDFVYFEKYVQERMINRKFNGRIQAELSRMTPFVMAAYEQGRERQGDIDLRIQRHGRTLGGGLALAVTAKASVEASLLRSRTAFDGGQIFRGIEIAKSLNRRTESLNVGVRYALTSLTTLSLDISRIRDYYQSDPTRNTDDRRYFGTLFFAPDAVIRGRAVLGYHRLRVQAPGIPFKGLLADINIGYTFRESSRFNFRYFRDTNASFDSPFNLQTQYAIDLTQDIAGPLKATAAASRQFMRHSENLFINQIARRERYDSWAVGLAFYWSTSVRSTLAYDFQRRRSTLPQENFNRERLIASLSLVL